MKTDMKIIYVVMLGVVCLVRQVSAQEQSA
jgi:hypothetical protein